MSQREDVVAYEESGVPERLPRVPAVVLENGGRAERLTVILPNYFKEFAFGGVVSAMELARELTRPYPAVRFLSLAPLGAPGEMFDFSAHVIGSGKRVTVESVADREVLGCLENEIFFCTHWTTALIRQAHARARAERGLAPLGFHYFIQDYEPGFFSYGVNHALCLSTYGDRDRTHAVFNSAELAAFFRSRGLRFVREQVLLPSPHPEIAARLAAWGNVLPPRPAAPLRIVAYGRPQSSRNCFEAVADGLRRFFQAMPESERAGYEILSAGREHPHIRLCPGAVMRSLGKLSMPDYLDLLARSHLGVSLMASPHPSYPPLEMALFGLETITNAFACKDLSRVHPGIRSLAAPCPEDLARALPGAVEVARRAGFGARPAILPTNMSPLPWRENVRRLGLTRVVAP